MQKGTRPIEEREQWVAGASELASELDEIDGAVPEQLESELSDV